MFEATNNSLHNTGDDDLQEAHAMFDHIKFALFHLLPASSYDNDQSGVLSQTTILARDNFWCSKGKAFMLEI